MEFAARTMALVVVMMIALAAAPRAANADATSPLDGMTEDDRVLVVTRARAEIERVTKYSADWVPTSGYPMGDIPRTRGACTDLVVRAFRAGGVDLQRLVHEDVVANAQAYGIAVPDATIDHRRVAVLLTWFRRNARAGLSLDATTPGAFRAGDVVFFAPTKTTPNGHVAVVSDRIGPRGLPLLIENGGPRPSESDDLDARPIVGHYRAGK